MKTLYDLTFAQLEARLREEGIPTSHARPIWRALYRGKTDLSPPAQRWFSAHAPPLPKLLAREPSADGVSCRFLLELADGARVESVLMRYRDRHTACLSVQAGCALACRFCATGRGGFTRDLSAGEIVAQLLHCRAEAPVRNVVLMGMGEPLLNYDAVMTALEIVTERGGLNIGPRHASLSTAGVAPGIVRMAQEQRPYRLAISLHAASDAERWVLMPGTRRWPLAELLAACRFYLAQTGRRILLEWVLIAGVNDSPAHAQKLINLVAGLDVHINLIALNLIESFEGKPSDPQTAEAFKKMLQAAGIPTTLRQRRGLDVSAGCGQLRGRYS